MISLAGKLIGPIHLRLKKRSGKMGQIVRHDLFEPKNACVICFSSVELTSSLVLYWRD